MEERRRTKILILGGGFAGLYAAIELEKGLARDPDVEVTLVNRENFFLFTPMLHEVAASDLDITHIVNPVRKLLRRVKFFDGVVDYVDLPNRRVGVSHGREQHGHELEYDHLILALGSVTNFYNLPGLAERALTMKTLGDAVTLRNRLISNLEEADFECCPRVREPLLNLVVAGGGFAGVETVAGVNDFLREAVRFYPHLKEEMLRVVLVHPGEVILPELGEKLGRYAQKKLGLRGVEIRTNTKVATVTDREVTLSDGERIVTSTLVWTAGTSPNPLLETLPCRRERGRLCADAFLEVEGWPGVWALGDCASVPDPATGRPYPPTAQHALRQGKVVARNIEAALRGAAKRPFAFKTIGQLAAIGRRTGVANICGVNFSGFVAWWLWRTIYLAKLPRFEKKLRVALDWTLDLLFTKDIVQFMSPHAPTVSRGRHDGVPTAREGVSFPAARVGEDHAPSLTVGLPTMEVTR
jgi:NADH dehydrogenase